MTNTRMQPIGNWHFRQRDMEEWLRATVPGCVHTDLLNNDKIKDPFYEMNEAELQWIDKEDWDYKSTFDVSQQMLEQDHVMLVFDGLDTYADVYLNDQHILSADNMFRTWRIDVKSFLTPSDNHLSVRFRSPIKEDLPKLERLGYTLPASNDQSERGGLGDKKLSVFARKAPYHYGWDWGPRFVTSGIWREVRLEAWSSIRIGDLFIHQKDVSMSSAKLTAVVEIESDLDWQGDLLLTTEGLHLMQHVSVSGGLNRIEIDFEIEQPKLWWSRGLGAQHLYTFTVNLLQSNQMFAEHSIQTGLRSIQLVQKEDHKDGTSFYFKLNGVPVFAKGANHIPNDSFLTDISYDRYKYEVLSAVESNMNMLRVWGGGIYESDEFYQLCDEYGILVWQDFMFACSMYPGDEAFLENVRLEAEENVKRLRNHPCLALWCGNNEIDTAWSEYDEDGGWGWKQQYTKEQRRKIWADYESIFHHILPRTVSSWMPGADYWPSSPMSSWTGDKDQHATNDSNMGDIHYWGVWHNVEPFSNYNIYLGRFMSEYGFQSFPELKTVQTYAENGDMSLESDVMRWHQRSGDGNRLIKKYMDMYSKEPKDFPSFLYMSQILQAEAIQSAIEAHRRRKPYCMGTLYWQINDCWPVASWSSMDYYGRWKALQYYAKRSYRDVLVSVDGTSETKVDVHVISDLLEPIFGMVRTRLFDFDGNEVFESKEEIEVGQNSGRVAQTFLVEELLQGYDRNQVVLVVELEQHGVVQSRTKHYFVPAKDIRLKTPSISVQAEEGSQGTRYVIETDTLARNVWISTESEGIFTDNFFDLLPNMPKTVEFRSYENGNSKLIPKCPESVVVKSLMDFVR